MGFPRISSASPFTDERVVHAPLQVVTAILADYLQQHGFATDQLVVEPGSPRISGMAICGHSTFRAIVQRKPKQVRFALQAESSDATRVRLWASYGHWGELALGFGSLSFWGVIWWLWNLLVSMRGEFLDGGRFAHVGAVVPAFGVGAALLLGFTWPWVTAFRLSRFLSEFYDYLSHGAALRHHAESPIRLPVAALIQMLVTSGGLLAIIFSILQIIPAGERVGVLCLFVPLLFIAVFTVLVGPGTVRVVVGHAAFIASIAFVIYLLIPLIILALVVDEVQRITESGSSLLWPRVGVLLMFALALWIVHMAAADACRLARVVDYWRWHAESHRWSGPWRRLGLGLVALPMMLVAGSLLLLSFWHSLLFCQSQLLGAYSLPHAVGFDQAAEVVGVLIMPVLEHLRLPNHPGVAGRWLLMLYVSPVVIWGACHAVAFLRELLRHLGLWRLVSLPADSPLHQTLREQAQVARLRIPRLRVDPSSTIQAYAAIAPLVLLPKLIVISQGAIDSLPRRCLVALVAHEVGHLRHGHTQLYTWLRMFSRVLMLGPSMLTGLIKPAVVLETQADAFAVNWLESHGGSRQDLVDALRMIERGQIASVLHRGSREGVAIACGPETDWLPSELRRRLETEQQDAFARRMVTRWRLLHYMTFHSDLANYTYNSLSERIEAIDSMPRVDHLS